MLTSDNGNGNGARGDGVADGGVPDGAPKTGAPQASDATPVAGSDDEVAWFVERFAGHLVDAGMPRMPARVFVRLLITDSGTLTAGELARALRISPAAVSGAVRYLLQVGLISRERAPGSRRDQYRVQASVWYEAIVGRDRIIGTWVEDTRVGISLVGSDSEAGRRLQSNLAFFEFLREEMAGLVARWRERQAAIPPDRRT